MPSCKTWFLFKPIFTEGFNQFLIKFAMFLQYDRISYLPITISKHIFQFFLTSKMFGKRSSRHYFMSCIRSIHHNKSLNDEIITHLNAIHPLLRINTIKIHTYLDSCKNHVTPSPTLPSCWSFMKSR